MSNFPRITLRVLEGADRGRVYDQLLPPITIGREEGNNVQLNDERVSRYHLKIQEDHEKLVLTDLESTNGTKVNGEEIQLRILRFGDRIGIGRSVLWFGSSEQIASRLRELREGSDEIGCTLDAPAQAEEAASPESPPACLDFELEWSPSPGDHATLHSLVPPDLPARLSPAQAAELAEVLEYFHVRIRSLTDSVQSDERDSRVTLDQRQWQNLLDIQFRLAQYLRGVGQPDADQ